ncbi:MAG: hypothetical protein ABIL09_05740 [Gemmatimonadota bacterium]
MAAGTISIGWARADITPTKKTLLQGQFHARLAAAATSPLTATALALETRAADGAVEQAVFLSCDLAGESFKADLVDRLGRRCPDLDRRKITINATHTHNAPPLHSGMYEEPENDPDFMPPEEYRSFLAERTAQAVAAAWEGRRPGALRRGFGYAVVGRCRRATYRDGSARMYGRTGQPDFLGLEACDDHAVNLLYTEDGDGRLTGTVVNLACTSQCDEGTCEVSADFWHEVRLSLASRFGSHVHLLPQCAPAGDASPHLLLDQREEKDLRGRMGLDDKGIIARRIMAAVEEGLACASPPESEVKFAHVVRPLQLPRLQVSDREYAMEKAIPALSPEELARQPWGFERRWPFGPVCDLISRYEQQGPHVKHETECHFIRLGDVAFATNPFELFMDYGARIRARSQALQTFLVQLADGSGDGFYLPTQRALDGGHYSALIKSNWVGPEGGRILVDETVAAIAELFAGQTYPTTR